jgi:hypothetical protein
MLVDVETVGLSVLLGGAGTYLLWRSWQQRKHRLRRLALAEKYSTSFQLHAVRGRPRLVVNRPQVADLPEEEQAAYEVRQIERQNQYEALELTIPLTTEPSKGPPSKKEHDDELNLRLDWIDEFGPPLNQHAAVVAEEEVGSGVEVAEASEEDETVIETRVEREGGDSGAVQISLAWDDYNDLDLHVFCPSGERIYFNNRTSGCGGVLDVDMNVRPVSDEPIENVVWKGNAPLGAYKVGVHFYKHHRKRRTKRTTGYTLRVVTHGRAKTYKGSIKYGMAMQMVTAFTLAELEK